MLRAWSASPPPETIPEQPPQRSPFEGADIEDAHYEEIESKSHKGEGQSEKSS